MVTITICLLLRDVERSVPEDHNDRHIDRSAVVYLRLGKGLLPSAAPTTTRDAGIAEEEVGRSTAPVEMLL